MRPVCAALSDRGPVRASNEDRLFTDSDRGIYIVADGMGGLPGGAIAAQLVVDRLPELVIRGLDGGDRLVGELAVQAVCRAVVELSAMVRHGDIGPCGMGATLVLACIRGSDALIASLGDSRAYLLRERRLRRLTTDHSLAELLVQSGDLTEEEAAAHPARTRLTRYVGMREPVSPEARIVPLVPGDRLLLCCDGLTSAVGDYQIAAVLQEEPDATAVCQQLVAAANAARGTDNITLITIDC